MKEELSPTVRIILGILVGILFAIVLFWSLLDGIKKLRNPEIPTRVRINWSDWLTFDTTSHIIGWFEIITSAFALIVLIGFSILKILGIEI